MTRSFLAMSMNLATDEHRFISNSRSAVCLICASSVLVSPFVLAENTASLTILHARNSVGGLRFKDRRQRNFYAIRCCAQLGTQKLALADAYGARLLRN